MSTALVIGGTGPTGPLVVDGLLERGFDVTILHGGQHEAEFAGPVRDIHADPHFAESLAEGLGSATFDLVVAQYGRLRVTADALAGRTGRVIAIGGATGLYAGPGDHRWGLAGRPALVPGTDRTYVADERDDKIGRRMVQAMERLFEHHDNGDYAATYIGYPVNYGPRTPGPYDWTIVRRLLDGRRRIVIADGGLKVDSRVFTGNAAASVLCCADQPEASAGKRYSVADEHCFTMRQRIEQIGRYMNADFELVDLPYELAWPCYPLYRHTQGHRMTDSALIRAELGYRDPVPASAAIERWIGWLLANQPERGGELERQVGDPFDYDAEDALIDRWAAARKDFGEVVSPLPAQGHQYRHPRKIDEKWEGRPNAAS